MTTADLAGHADGHDNHDSDVPGDEHFGKATGGKIAMWMFIAQDGMSFGGLLFAYGVIRSSAESWPEPAAVLGITLTAIATFLLICSSLTMVMAVESAKECNKASTMRWLMLTILGGATFLGIQAYEYYHLSHAGLGLAVTTMADPNTGGPINNLFGSTFYAVTGFHGLHVFSGVVYLICILIGTMRGKYTQGGMSYSRVELVGLFWHFVDLVWILVFTFIYLL